MDTTSTLRQSKRTAALDARARAQGWESWSEYATAVKNGQIDIVCKPDTEPDTANIDKVTEDK